MFTPKIPERRTDARRWQFGLGALLFMTLIVAVVLGMRLPQRLLARWQVVTAVQNVKYDEDIDIRVSLLLASMVSLVAMGIVFAAGRSHAVTVSSLIGVCAVGLLLFGISASGGMAVLSFYLAGGLLIGMAIGWTTQSVDEA